MKGTKQKILDISLDLFAQNGFSAVSIRDICGRVGIRESSVYYHFKNKQAILDELLQHFEATAAGFMLQLEEALKTAPDTLEENFFGKTCDCFFEAYLMDEYCNKIMRLLSIERFCNDEIQNRYDHWMIDRPLAFQAKVFSVLVTEGIVKPAEIEYLAVKFYAPVFLLMQRFLLCGALTEECRQAFREKAYRHIQNFFMEMGE